ncbi:hypothetical protein EMIT036CA2_110052 [Chryseobacterium sp. IT-36CA2]
MNRQVQLTTDCTDLHRGQPVQYIREVTIAEILCIVSKILRLCSA